MADAIDRLYEGDEATVRYEPVSDITSKTQRFRGVFLGTRERDGSLTFYIAGWGFKSAPPDAEVTIHRKRKLPVPKMVRDRVDENGRTIKDEEE